MNAKPTRGAAAAKTTDNDQGGRKGASRRAAQRKMLAKIYKIISETPQDDRGLVPDTTFSEAGVARLMQVLEERSADASKPGAKAASNVLRYLKPETKADATPSGASKEKLQKLSKRMESLRNRRKGGKSA